jgi:5-methylcytosine-specific restriction protein A
LGEGVIHVHHLRELATLGKEYEVDPINDLRPVCPNCHAILHTSTPAMTINQLRKVLAERTPVLWPGKPEQSK